MKITAILVQELLLQGIDLQYKNVSISGINEKLYASSKRRGYQVHCDYYKLKFSEVYSDLEIAADKFIGIKNQLERLYAQQDRDYQSKKESRNMSEVSSEQTK